MATIEATGTSKSSTATKPTTILVTSFPSNPITTTFKPSADCSGFYLNSNNIFVFADQTSCLPTTFNSQLSSFYSPGFICPQGYSTACHDTTGVSSITTVTCCPARGDVSLSCVPDPLAIKGGFANFFCTWSAGTTTTLSVTLSDGGVTRTTTYSFAGAEGVNAYGVRMVYESTDLSTSSTRSNSNSKSTKGTATPTTTNGTSTPTSSPTSASSSGMSTGAKVAIGVVIPLVVLAILAIVFLLWRRRKSKYKAVASAQSPGGSAMNDNKPPPEYGSAPIYELDNSGEPRELIGDTPVLRQTHPAQLGDSR